MVRQSFLIIIVFMLALPAVASRHCRSERFRSYAEQLATLEPSADLNLLDIDLFPGGSMVAGFEYEVEPAYTKGLYSRTDRWLVSTKALPGRDVNIADGIDARLTAGLENQTVATFTRFFKDPCAAMLANPYSPRRIPLKAEVALGPKFKQGDYFLFRGSVGFVASAEIMGLISSSLWGIGLSGSYLVEGFYQLHIVRLSEKHVRLKIVAHRGKEIKASLGVGFEGDFEVFGVSPLDRQLEKFVNTKPLKLQGHVGKSNVFMVDYVLDLTDPDVEEAFERVLPKAKQFRNLNLAGPFRGRKNLEANLLLDLTPLEELYRSDYANERVDRIKRNFRTSSDQNAYGFGLHAGNRILGFKLDKGISTARMSIMQEDETLERFLLKSWERDWDGRFLYSWSRSIKASGFQALFTANDSFEELRPVNMVKFVNHKKTRFTFKDFQKLKLELRKSLPHDIYRGIPFSSWPQKEGQKFINFGLRYQLIMAPESILEAPDLSAEEIKVFYRDHLKSKGLSAIDFYADNYGDSNLPTAEESFTGELSSMARILSKALDQKVPAMERLEMITKLRMNKLFSETGLSFLMSLQPAKQRQYYHLDLDISSNEALIDYSYGEAEISSLYKKILTIKAALDDDALDLIREAESLSLPEGR